MRSARFVMAAALVTLVTPASSRAQIFDRCDHVRQLNDNVAMTVGPLLRVHAGAGTLRIRGVEGLREARIRGTACASSAALLDQLSVSVQRSSAHLTIETRFPDQRDGFSETMRIDLVLEVPAGVLAEIEDGSGDADISGLGATTINDGSGALRVSDMLGSVAITDGSGDLDIDGVAGEVEINDGSGSIDLTDVRGSVRVTDGSGSIAARNVRGNFIVASDGSGGVDYANVDGRVQVPNRR